MDKAADGERTRVSRKTEGQAELPASPVPGPGGDVQSSVKRLPTAPVSCLVSTVLSGTYGLAGSSASEARTRDKKSACSVGPLTRMRSNPLSSLTST